MCCEYAQPSFTKLVKICNDIVKRWLNIDVESEIVINVISYLWTAEIVPIVLAVSNQ